jgi:hypothetical protein
MDKRINFTEFMRYLLDDEGLVGKGAKIIRGLLEAQSPRLTNISEKMAGNSASNYKVIQRFIKKVDLKKLLMRLYQEDAEFIIGDATEMERYKAPKTSYVGILSDGKTAGYWLMVLSTHFVDDHCRARLWCTPPEPFGNKSLHVIKSIFAVLQQ